MNEGNLDPTGAAGSSRHLELPRRPSRQHPRAFPHENYCLVYEIYRDTVCDGGSYRTAVAKGIASFVVVRYLLHIGANTKTIHALDRRGIDLDSLEKVVLDQKMHMPVQR